MSCIERWPATVWRQIHANCTIFAGSSWNTISAYSWLDIERARWNGARYWSKRAMMYMYICNWLSWYYVEWVILLWTANIRDTIVLFKSQVSNWRFSVGFSRLKQWNIQLPRVKKASNSTKLTHMLSFWGILIVAIWHIQYMYMIMNASLLQNYSDVLGHFSCQSPSFVTPIPGTIVSFNSLISQKWLDSDH